MFIHVVEKFQRYIYGILIGLLIVVIAFAVIELLWQTITSLTNYPPGLLENHELISVLGVFLLVLIGVELLDTMLEYFKHNTIHVEIVVLLAIIAIARKVLLLEPSATNGIELIGIGIVIVGLAAAYYMLKKAGIPIESNNQKPPDP